MRSVKDAAISKSCFTSPEKQTKDRFKKQLITDPQDGNVYLQRSGNVSKKGLFPQRLASFCLVNPSRHRSHGMRTAAEEKVSDDRPAGNRGFIG